MHATPACFDWHALRDARPNPVPARSTSVGDSYNAYIHWLPQRQQARYACRPWHASHFAPQCARPACRCADGALAQALPIGFQPKPWP